ncbi:MAG TPA: cupin [Chitinophagaceae bacterium]|nr:cupin [Chitinophagaceae bacterium]
MPYLIQRNPVSVPVPGGKLIHEHIGYLATGSGDISIAQMEAPPGWGEPFQEPEFDEYTLVYAGTKLVEVDGERIEVHAGESILVKKSSRVRYSNPFGEPCAYWSVCLPAFSLDAVHRDPEQED